MFVALCSLYATAQRKVVYVEPLKSNTNIPQGWLEDVRSQLIRVIDGMGRVTVVDGQGGKTSAQTAKADYIVRGNLTKAICDVRTGKNEGEDSFVAEYAGNIQLVDANTGSVIADKGISSYGSCRIKLPTISRRDRNYRREVHRLEEEASNKAYDSAMSSDNSAAKSIIEENIKIKANISGITQIKGDEARGVTIDQGTFSGVSDGDRFNVSIVENVGNYPTVTKIAEIRVTNQPTLHSAECKVVSGKRELKQALEAGKKLTVISRTSKLFDL